jgi:hypothetical protein
MAFLKSRYFVLVVLVVLVVALLMLTFFGKRVVQHRVNEAVTAMIEASCERSIGDCQFRFEHSKLSLFPLKVRFSGVRLSAGSELTTAYYFRMESIALAISARALLSRALILDDLLFDGVEVVITEGDRPSNRKSKDEPESEQSVWTIAVEHTQIERGAFTYIRKSTRGSKPRRAILQVKDISGTISRIGAPRPGGEANTVAEAAGRLEDSGRFDLKIVSDLFSSGLAVDLDLRICEQNLGDLSAFFMAEEGIRLKGVLKESHASVAIRERKLSAWVLAKYRDLGIQFHRIGSKGALAVFFTNLVTATQLNRTNIETLNKDQVRGVDLLRRTNETLIQFILRGMKDAALKVATE